MHVELEGILFFVVFFGFFLFIFITVGIAGFFIIRFRLSKRGQESEGGTIGKPLGKTGITIGGHWVNDFKRKK